MSDDLFEITADAGLPKKERWLARAFVQQDTIYLPAGAFVNELSAMLAAGWDGDVPMVKSDDNHVYLPVAWLLKEYPQHAEDITHVAGIIHRHCAQEESPDA